MSVRKKTGLSEEEHGEMATMMAVIQCVAVTAVAVPNTYPVSSRVHRAYQKCERALFAYRNALDEHFYQITRGAGSYFGERAQVPDDEAVTIGRAQKLAQAIRLRQQREREGGPS